MRKDSYGFFWEDAQTSIRSKSAEKEKRQRPLAPIPDTGWEPPKEFPRLSSASVIGFDTETYDPDLKTKGPGVRRDGHIIGISVATEDRSWYFPMRHTIGPNLDRDPVNYTNVVNAVIQGVGGVQAEYLLRILTFPQIYDVAKYVVTARSN